jgi:antitoxin VapB
MGMSIKNREVEELAEELSRTTNTSKTEVIRLALLEKQQRLVSQALPSRRERLLAYLENRVWPSLPASASRRLSKAEEEEILGYGHHGV